MQRLANAFASCRWRTRPGAPDLPRRELPRELRIGGIGVRTDYRHLGREARIVLRDINNSRHSYLSSAIRVEAERAGSECNHLQQTAGDRDVLEEVDELIQVREV